VLGPTHSGESGIELVLGNTQLWLVEMAHKRACFQIEGHFDQEDQEVDMHPFLHEDQRSLDSAQTVRDLGSVRNPVVAELGGIHTEILESMTPVKRAT
jgi:hypothetical protein